MDALKQDLNSTIDEMLERKGSSIESREEALKRYNRILTSHHFGDVLYARVDDILASLSKSIKAESSTTETVRALKAVALTAVSFENGALYDTMSALVKRTIEDSQDNATKAAALHCLGICLTFGGASEGEFADTCTWLLEIVQSDGAFVGADDNAEVVAAAIQTYGYLVTELHDVEAESEDAVEAFMEQLDSGDADVQIAAGEAIALLFEKSCTPREDDEDGDGEEADEADSDDSNMVDKNLVKRYNAYHNPAEVLDKVQDLANLSSKGLNKTDKQKLHRSFASIALTVEEPRGGLRSNNASKLVVRIAKEGEIKVDKWWKLMRLNALRRLLAGGFIQHYFEGNKQVLNSLPLLVRSTRTGGTLSPGRGSRRTPRRGDKYRNDRRFVAADEG